MPTAIASTPETQAASELPARLWRDYRFQRREGARQSVAASMALEGSGYTSQSGRERMAALLIEREEMSGLALSPEELEAAVLAEAAALDNAEPGSAEAIRADAERMVGELERARARLAPEALSDPDVRAEVESIDAQLVQARATAKLVEDAETEIGRRAREAREQAERQAHEDAETQAQALQPQIVKAAARLDTAASTFAEAVAAFRDLKQLQAGAIAGTDRGPEAVRARSYRPQEVASALHVALRARGVEVEGVTGSNSALPLAATEPEKL